jgi:hypothetical protein
MRTLSRPPGFIFGISQSLVNSHGPETGPRAGLYAIHQTADSQLEGHTIWLTASAVEGRVASSGQWMVAAIQDSFEMVHDKRMEEV